MNDEELQSHLAKVMSEAKKAVDEANKALERADAYFLDQKLSPEDLIEYVKLNGGPDALRDLDRQVEQKMNEIKAESQSIIDQAFGDTTVKSSRKKFRSLI
jgi:F0F1-type ATP synthase membrane subunit b/b'